jgi:hypothetical protein
MKILLLDIETAPNTAYVWGIFKENIPLARLLESGYVMCYSAKWYGEDKIVFDSVWNSGTAKMLEGIHSMMDEADAIIHYNGNRFDIPTLNKEFLINGFPPPSPAKQIDLYLTVKKVFKFVSNKLDYVAQQLGVGKKHETSFELWVGCMNGDNESQFKMEEYNVNDVMILEGVYTQLKPWIKNHANHGLYTEGGLVCPNCGGNHYTKRGFAFTHAGKYQRFQCKGCGNWFRAKKAEQTNTFVNIN